MQVTNQTRTAESDIELSIAQEIQTLAPGMVINDKYRIVRLLGEGGMGRVYEVEHLQLSSKFALKIITTRLENHAQSIDRFLREAKLLAKLEHPNVVRVFDQDQYHGRPYLVMEQLDGIDLAESLRRDGAPEPRITLDLIKQIGAGLNAAHAAAIIHRDLKPHNLFLCRAAKGESSRVVVLDFGLARSLNPSPGSFATQAEGTMFVGTAAYASPEQARGEADLDARSDQFALGTIVYELLCGRKAFARSEDPTPDILKRVKEDHPPPLPWPRLDKVVRRAMAKERGDRYPDVKHFVEALTKAGTRDLRGRRFPWMLLLAAGMLLMALGFSLNFRGHGERLPSASSPTVALASPAHLDKPPEGASSAAHELPPPRLAAPPLAVSPATEPPRPVRQWVREPFKISGVGGEAQHRIARCLQQNISPSIAKLRKTTFELVGRFEDGLLFADADGQPLGPDLRTSLMDCLRSPRMTTPLPEGSDGGKDIRAHIVILGKQK